VLQEDFFHCRRSQEGDFGTENDTSAEENARKLNNQRMISSSVGGVRANDYYRYAMQPGFLMQAQKDYNEEQMKRVDGASAAEASQRASLDAQLFTLERRIGVVSTLRQNKETVVSAATDQRGGEGSSVREQRRGRGRVVHGQRSPASNSSGWESRSSFHSTTSQQEKANAFKRDLVRNNDNYNNTFSENNNDSNKGSSSYQNEIKSVVDIAMNFTNFLGWTNYRSDNLITNKSHVNTAQHATTISEKSYPTEASVVNEIDRKPRMLCAVAAAYEDVKTNHTFATSRFILLSACVSRSTETTTRTIPQFETTTSIPSSSSSSSSSYSSSSTAKNALKAIANKSKKKKKIVVISSDSTAFPQRQQQQQQHDENVRVRVLAPKIEVTKKESVETFLLVRSIGGYREMVLKPTTAALPWFPGEENAVTCITLAPSGGRALVGTTSGKCYIVDLNTTLNPKFVRDLQNEENRRKEEDDSDSDDENNNNNNKRSSSENLAKTPKAYNMHEAVRMLAQDKTHLSANNNNNTNNNNNQKSSSFMERQQQRHAKARSVVWWRRAKDNKEIAICGDSTGVVRLWDIESGELLMTTQTRCNPLRKLQLVEAIDDRHIHEILKQQSQRYFSEDLTSDLSVLAAENDATTKVNNSKKAEKKSKSSTTFLLISKRVTRERDENGNLICTKDKVDLMRQKFRQSRMSINENYEEKYNDEYKESAKNASDAQSDDDFDAYKDVDSYFQTLDLETYSAKIDEILCIPEQNFMFSGPEKIGSRFGHDGYETHENSLDSPSFDGGVLVSRPENFSGHSTLEHGGKSFMVSSFAEGRVDLYDAQFSDSKVISSFQTPNFTVPRFAHIVDAFVFLVTSSRSIAVISRATNMLVQKIVLPVEYGAIRGLVRGIPVRSSKYELAINVASDIRADDNDTDFEDNANGLGKNSILLEGVACWTASRVFEITPTASVFDLYEKLALSGQISKARHLAEALSLDAAEIALHACQRALNARRGDTAAAMYFFAVRSDLDSPQKRYKMLSRFCDACLRAWHLRATSHLLETMDEWNESGFESEPSSPAVAFSRRGSGPSSRAGSLGGSPSHSGGGKKNTSRNSFTAEKSFRADARECLKRSRDRDIEVAVQNAKIARANIIAWSSKEGVAVLKACDELLDAEVSASASTTVVIIKEDGTEEEISREQFEGMGTQFEPLLADSEFIKEFVERLALTCCADCPTGEQFGSVVNSSEVNESSNLPKWQRMENAIKSFEDGNRNAFDREEEDLSIENAGGFKTPTDSPKKQQLGSKDGTSSSSTSNLNLFEAKRASGRTRERTNEPKTETVSVHARTVGTLVRALNVGSSEEDILFFASSSTNMKNASSSSISAIVKDHESETVHDGTKNDEELGDKNKNTTSERQKSDEVNIPQRLSIALPTLFWALGEEGRTTALSYNHSRSSGMVSSNSGVFTNISPSVSPRASEQQMAPFNTNKLFDAYHNQKSSATFQKRIINPELRVNCLLAHVAMEPANSERKLHFQRELEAEIKRAVLHSRNYKADDDITSEGRVLLQIVGAAVAWSNDAALSTVAAQLGHFESANAFRIDIVDRLFLRIDEAKRDEQIIRDDIKNGENDETIRLLSREFIISKRAIERELRFALEHLVPKCKDAKKRALCTQEIAIRWKNAHMKDFLTWDEFERATLRAMPPEEGELATFELLKLSHSASSSNASTTPAHDKNTATRLTFSANFALKAAIAPSLPSLRFAAAVTTKI